jgi:hypothetical protein
MKRTLSTIAVWLTLASGAGAATVTIDSNRNFLVDGQPFFPIMQWLQSTGNIDKNVALGINTFTGVWEQDTTKALTYLNAYQARGVWGVVNFDADSRVVSHPSLLGWIFGDEPDLQSNAIPPSTILAEYNAIKAVDPNHPVLLTLTAGFYAPLNHVPAWMNGSDSYYYDYCAAADVVGFDIYPIYGWCRKDWLAYVGGAQDELRVKYSRGLRSTYQWIECVKCCSKWCSYPERSAYGPYPNEIRAEVWLAIVHGAKSIGYFTHTWRSSDCSASGDAYYSQYQLTTEQEAEITRTNRQITALTPVIARGDLDAVQHRVVSGGGRVDVLAKVKGSDLYVIAVNVLHAAASNDQVVELEIPGLASASTSATVYEEGRTLPIVGRKLTDSFSAAVPVHIYVIPNYAAPPSRLKVKR